MEEVLKGCIADKEDDHQAEIACSSSGDRIVVVKDQALVHLKVANGAGDSSQAIGQEEANGGRSPGKGQEHHCIDQIVNDKSTERREGKFEEILINHQTISDGTKMGTGIIIYIDGFDRNFCNQVFLAGLGQHVHFILISITFDS